MQSLPYKFYTWMLLIVKFIPFRTGMYDPHVRVIWYSPGTRVFVVMYDIFALELAVSMLTTCFPHGWLELSNQLFLRDISF